MAVKDSFKLVNVFYKNRNEGTLESCRKYFYFWYQFFIEFLIGFVDVKDKNFIEYLDNVIHCEFCSFEVRRKILGGFGLILHEGN